jgi:hypothetical protein
VTWGQRGATAALLLAASVAGCTDVSTDPDVPFSLQFDSLPAQAVVIGDTMRGEGLIPAAVPIKVFNSSGGLVTDSAITLRGIDTQSVSSFRVIAGRQLVGTVLNGAVRVVAQAGALQSQTQTFAVVNRPRSIVAGDTTSDSIVYDFTDSTTRNRDITATLLDSTNAAVNGLRVRFRVASFTTTILDSVRLISPSGGRSIVSTLVTSGLATIRVKAYPKAGATGRGTIVVEATSAVLGAPVSGSPLALTVRLVPFTITP